MVISCSLYYDTNLVTRKSIQTKAEDIGSGRDGSLVTKTEEVPITELNLENSKEIQGRNFKSSDTTMNKESINNLATISKQLEKNKQINCLEWKRLVNNHKKLSIKLINNQSSSNQLTS